MTESDQDRTPTDPEGRDPEGRAREGEPEDSAGSRSPGGTAGSTRRAFVNTVIGASGAAVGASVLYPVISYLIPPAGASEAETARVALSITPDEMAPNSGRIFRFGSRPGILIRTPEGDFRAFDAICTHLDCTVQYRNDIQHIWCACHNGHYDLQGRNIKGPPPRPLDEFAVHVTEDEIVVSREA